MLEFIIKGTLEDGAVLINNIDENDNKKYFLFKDIKEAVTYFSPDEDRFHYNILVHLAGKNTKQSHIFINEDKKYNCFFRGVEPAENDIVKFFDFQLSKA